MEAANQESHKKKSQKSNSHGLRMLEHSKEGFQLIMFHQSVKIQNQKCHGHLMLVFHPMRLSQKFHPLHLPLSHSSMSKSHSKMVKLMRRISHGQWMLAPFHTLPKKKVKSKMVILNHKINCQEALVI